MTTMENKSTEMDFQTVKGSLLLPTNKKPGIHDNFKKPLTFKDGASGYSTASLENSWLHYAFYLQIIILYFLMFSLYNELRRTKEAMYDFHMNMINISIKGMEIEKECMTEISSFRKTLEQNQIRRIKRSEPNFPFGEGGSYIDINIQDNAVNETNSFNEGESHIRTTRKAEKDRRDNQQKKHRKHSRRRQYHGFPRATHLIGAYPEPIIKDGGIIAPWLIDRNAIRDFGLVTNIPQRGREAVEIIDSGLYFIYAQVYYNTPNDPRKAHNSFHIIQKTKSGGEMILAQCATIGDSSLGGEASCFTATAQSLSTGDTIYVKQRERERHIIMKKGQTFLGLILLNKREKVVKNQAKDVTPTAETTRSSG